MTPFTERQKRALSSLLTFWPREKFVVVGATAIGVHLGLHWRGTYDLDLTVAASPGSFEEELQRQGWSRNKAMLQRWFSPDNQPVDIIPASKEAIVAGGFTWPDGSARISLVGFRMTFENAVPVPIGGHQTVQVATLPSVVVLKIAAYTDRPSERGRDLEDLAHILEESVKEDSLERWADEVVDLEPDYDDVGPYLLGRSIAREADAAEMSVVDRFVQSVLEDPGQEILTNLIESGGPLWREDSDIAERRVEWFRSGLRSVAPDDAVGR